MKNRLRFLLPFLLLLTFVFATIRAAVPISGPLAPASASATYATHDAQFGKGGLTYWTNHTTIPTARRAAGMIVFDTTSSNYWQLGTNLTSWTQTYLPVTDVEGNLTTVSNTAVTITGNLTTVSNLATAALPKAGGTMAGALLLSGNATANLNPVALQQLATSNAAVFSAFLATNAASSNALQAVISTLIPQPFQFTSSGLTLTIRAGSYMDSVGLSHAYDGGAFACIANYTNHVYLINGSPMGFSRNIHRGGIYLGYAITDASGVTAVVQPKEIKPFRSRIGRWLAGQKLGVPQKVAAIGDSITQGAQASSSLGFANILFSSTHSAAGRNVLNVANITLSNYGQSGASVEWGLAFTGEMISRPQGGVGQFFKTSMHRTRYMNAISTPSQKKTVGTPIHLKTRFDLVAIGFGNASSWNIDLTAAHLETVVQRIQDLGCEVILHTEQPFYNGGGGSINNWAILQDGQRMQDIADSRCCELADTFGAMQFLHDAGLETSYYNTDHTHPNTAGHDIWALVLGSVCDPRQAREDEAYPPKRSQYPVGVYANAYGSGLDVCFEYSGTGVAGADPNGSGFGAPNLNTMATGAGTGANAYLLTAGQRINVTHGGCTGIGIITGLPAGSTATCHMTDQSGSTWGSSFTISGSFGDQVTKIYQLGDFLAFSGGVGNWWEGGNTPSRLPCYGIDMQLVVDSFTGAETQLPVVCTFFETPRRIDIGSFQQTGTWAVDLDCNHEFGCPVPYTDTVGSFATIPFSTDMLEVWINAGSQVGQLDGWVDGEQLFTSSRLISPSGTGFIYHLFVQPQNSPINHTTQVGYRTARTAPHYAYIYLRTAGASPVSGNRSLQIISVNGLNFE